MGVPLMSTQQHAAADNVSRCGVALRLHGYLHDCKLCIEFLHNLGDVLTPNWASRSCPELPMSWANSVGRTTIAGPTLEPE